MRNANSNHDTMGDIRRIIAIHRWRFILASFAVTLCVLIGSLFLPHKYEARAIFERRNDLVMSEIAGRGAPQSFTRLKSSLVEELSGVPAIEQVINDLNLAPLPGPDATLEQRQEAEMARQELLGRIRRNLRVTFDMSTSEVDRIQVTYIGQDAPRSRAIVNRLVQNYIDSSRRQIDQMLRQASTFFKRQAAEKRQEIAALEEQRLKFEIKHAEVLPDDPSSLQGTVAEAEEKLTLAREAVRNAEQRVVTYKAELAALDGADGASVVMTRNPELARLEEQYRQYQMRLEEALVIKRMTENHPTVQSLRRKIADLKAEMDGLPEEVVAERHLGSSAKRTQLELSLLQARSDLDEAKGRERFAEERVAQMRSQTTQFFSVRSDYRRIERQIEDVQREVNFWNDNVRRVEMTLEAELGQRGITMEFIKPCGKISRPSSPDFVQVIFAAVGLGLGAGIGWVLLAERADQTISQYEQAEAQCGLPVLGSVAEIIASRQAYARNLARAVLYPVTGMAMGLILLAGVYLNYMNLYSTAPLHESFGWAESLIAGEKDEAPAVDMTAEVDTDATPLR